MFICTQCGAQYVAWLSRCGRCHFAPLLDQEAIMAKITRHGGASDVTADEDEPVEAVEAAEPVDGSDGAAEPSEDESGDEGTESEPDGGDLEPADPNEDPEATEAIDLPAVNALKTVWEQTLLDAGFSNEWVYAEGRTKDDLIEHGRGLADGSEYLDAEGKPAAVDPTDD